MNEEGRKMDIKVSKEELVHSLLFHSVHRILSQGRNRFYYNGQSSH